MTAAFGGHLILQHDSGKARFRELVHRALHIGGIAVAGVSITDHGDRHGIADRAAPIDYFRYQQEARAQPACSTSRADKASKQQGIRWQVSCSSKRRSCSVGAAVRGTACDSGRELKFIMGALRVLNPLAQADLSITPGLRRQLGEWLQEDLGRGDLSAAALRGREGEAHWQAKADGVFCGGVLLEPLLRELLGPSAPGLESRVLVRDGTPIKAGQRLLELRGPADQLVAMERTALNLAMRLSGIATATSSLVRELEGSGVALADTRKTTPGLRELEKYAVRCGGGVNHRMGLDDAAMLKENHLAWAGGVTAAILAVRAQAPWPARVIVEAETAEEAQVAVAAGADALLLDEFSPKTLATLVPLLRAQAEARPTRASIVLEASGVNPADLKLYATTGVDLISTSAPMTRSAWLDLSMRFTSTG